MGCASSRRPARSFPADCTHEDEPCPTVGNCSRHRLRRSRRRPLREARLLRGDRTRLVSRRRVGQPGKRSRRAAAWDRHVQCRDTENLRTRIGRAYDCRVPGEHRCCGQQGRAKTGRRPIHPERWDCNGPGQLGPSTGTASTALVAVARIPQCSSRSLTECYSRISLAAATIIVPKRLPGCLVRRSTGPLTDSAPMIAPSAV